MILRNYRMAFHGHLLTCAAHTKSEARGIFRQRLGVRRLRAKVRLTKHAENEET